MLGNKVSKGYEEGSHKHNRKPVVLTIRVWLATNVQSNNHSVINTTAIPKNLDSAG